MSDTDDGKLTLHFLDMVLKFDNDERGRKLYAIYNPATLEDERERLKRELYGPRRSDYASQKDYAKAVVEWSPGQKGYFGSELG
ncbi:MAG: hypothetical protein IT558_03765 [Alphaproteobacteria bacterium]|nr:hypothetical protein [Alphaproteobacteria bacterium]